MKQDNLTDFFKIVKNIGEDEKKEEVKKNLSGNSLEEETIEVNDEKYTLEKNISDVN